MSDKIPEFYTGQRIQAMQTSSNEAYGIDAVCGVVVVRRNQFDIVCFFENGKVLSVDSSSLIHIDEATYQNWKKNGVDTSKTVAERKQGEPQSA
ncbi:MAG TPA: hypothetical protein DCP47_01445 [Phycisphaerales bacterium]|nr:hypothetical protein [Phycisphaerales bacterium]